MIGGLDIVIPVASSFALVLALPPWVQLSGRDVRTLSPESEADSLLL
jgi:hypothetical protein